MHLTKLILFLAALLLLLPGTALAEPQEQLFLRQVSVGSFDVWQHSDGTWQDTDHDGAVDPYGQTNKTLKPEVFTLPQTQYTSGFTVTRVKVEYDFTLTNEELKNAGRSEIWDEFIRDYLRYLPNNYSTAKTGEDLAQGTVTIKKTLDLMPKLLNLKDPAVRAELGMSDRDFSDMAQGWRWYTPVLIEWYGVPKAEVPPDLSNNLSVQITDYPDKVTESEQGQVVAKVTNTSGKYVMTDLVWRINGQTVKSFDNFDLMSNAISALDFTMPGDDITIEVEVNPNHNRPPDEVSWDDNKAVCKVKYEPKKALENTANITIVAPDHVKFGNGWQFTVQVTTDIPKPYVRPGRPDPPQPKVKLSVNSPSGSKFINQYTWENGNWGAIINVPPNGFPVEPTWPDITYTAEFGEYTHIETFTFPPSGMADRNMNIVLYADADCTNYEVPYMHASKNVVVDALIPLDPRSVLTQ
ncbi:hypothetical protein [Desulfoscipio gibsoniae]